MSHKRRIIIIGGAHNTSDMRVRLKEHLIEITLAQMVVAIGSGEAKPLLFVLNHRAEPPLLVGALHEHKRNGISNCAIQMASHHCPKIRKGISQWWRPQPLFYRFGNRHT